MQRLARPLLVVLGALIPLVPFAEAWAARDQAAGPNDTEIRRLQDYHARRKLGVRLLDGIATALPEHLWLDRLTVSAEKVAIEGRAFNTNAIANFIENLDKLPEFSEPSLRSTAEEGGIYRFVLNLEAARPAAKGTPAAKDPLLSGLAAPRATADVLRGLRRALERPEITSDRFLPGAMADRSLETVLPVEIRIRVDSYQDLADLFDRLARFSPVVALKRLEAGRSETEQGVLSAAFTVEVPFLKDGVPAPGADRKAGAAETETRTPVRSERQPFQVLNHDEAARRTLRPEGVPGLLIDNLEPLGLFRTSKGYVAQVRDRERNRNYLLKEGDRLFDGEVLRISKDEAVLRRTQVEAGAPREVILRLPGG